MPTNKIIDFEYFGIVGDIQDSNWKFQQSEDTCIQLKAELNCSDDFKEEYDSFFINDNDELLCMNNTIPYLHKSLYKPVYQLTNEEIVNMLEKLQGQFKDQTIITNLLGGHNTHTDTNDIIAKILLASLKERIK